MPQPEVAANQGIETRKGKPMSEETPAIEKLKQAIEEREYKWTYFNVLTGAFVLTRSTQFSADSTNWYRAIYEIRESLKEDDEHPLEVWYTYRGYSEEVERFMSLMHMSDIMGTLTLYGKTRYIVTTKTKQQLIDRRSNFLDEHREVLQRIADALDEKLGLEPLDIS